MPLLGYKKEIAPYVKDGSKSHTIRAFRKDGRDPKPGDTLYHYAGLRTKACRKLCETICKTVEPIAIGKNGEVMVGIDDGIKILSVNEQCRLAWKDGFRKGSSQADRGAFFEFFRNNHGLPFKGLLISW